MAAPDLAAENPLTGAVADIGIQQDRGGALQARDLDEPGQRRYQRAKTVQLIHGEAAGLLGSPARRVNRAVALDHGQRDIVGDPFLAHVVEKGKAFAFRIVDAASDFPALAEYDGQRAVEIFRRIQHLETRRAHGDFGAGPPDKIAADDIGMQGPDEDADTPER